GVLSFDCRRRWEVGRWCSDCLRQAYAALPSRFCFWGNSRRCPKECCHTTPSPAGCRALVLGLSSTGVRSAALTAFFGEIRGAAQMGGASCLAPQRDGGRWCSDCLRRAFATLPSRLFSGEFAALRTRVKWFDCVLSWGV